MSRNYVLNTGNGVTLFVGSNQNVGFHTARPSEKLTFDEGNAKFNSNVYVMKRVGVNMSNPEVELDVTGDAHVTGDINIDGDMNIKNPISVNGFYVIRNSNQILKTHLSAAVKNMQVGTGGTVFALTNTSQEFNFVVTSNLTSIMRVPGAGPVNLYRPLMMSGDILPASNITYDIGSSNLRFKDLYLSGKTIILGDIKLTSESNALQIKNSNETAGFPLAVSELLLQDKGESYKFRNIGGQVAVFSVSNAIESIEPISTVPNIFLSNSNIGVGVQQPIAKFQVSEDSILSVARVGNFPLDKSLALFSHCNVAASSAYALMQSSIGDTYLNAGLGRAIRFRINNADVGMFSYSGRLGIGTISPSCTLHVQSTDAVQIPSGTTGQRPGVPNAGHIRYNTTLNAYEGYGPGNAWGTLGGVKDTNQDTYIAPELVTGSNDDILRFYNSNVETMRLSQCNLNIRVPTVATADVYVMSNLGVGTSNPTERFHIASGKLLASTNQILGYTGDTATTPAFAWGDDSNTGLFHPAEDTVAITNNGTETVRITSTGNVGIGTTNPTTKLDVRGDLAIGGGSSSTNTIRFSGVAGDGPSQWTHTFISERLYNKAEDGLASTGTNDVSELLLCKFNDGEVNPSVGPDRIRVAAPNIVFSTLRSTASPNASTVLTPQFLDNSNTFPVSMIIRSSGNVGIGTAAPLEVLDLRGNIRASSNAYILNSMGVRTSNPQEAVDTQGNIKASGNVYALTALGVGNSNPAEALDVIGSAKISSNLEVLGNMTVRGITTMINSTTVNIADNVIQLNNGAAFTSTLQAGIEINRGDATKSNYMFVFEEQSSAFKIGESGQLQCVATRDDTPPNYSVPYWNATAKKFNTVNSFAYVEGKLGVGTGLPIERLHVSGNAQVSSNLYVLSRVGIANNTPTEAIDITGNIKTSQNIYALNRISVGNSNPTEALDLIGNLKTSSNVYAMNRLGVGNSNPSEAIDVTGNLKTSSNLFVMTSMGIRTSNNLSEALDLIGNLKASSNMYAMNRLGVANSNPSEAINVTGNLKASSNVYAMNRLGVANSNPSEAIDVTGNLKTSSNLFVMTSVGIRTSNNLSEALDLIGNLKTSSNVYAMNRLGVANSNPSEAIDVTGNLKTSANLFVMTSMGIRTSNNLSEALDLIGNLKASSNMYAMNRLGVATSNPLEAIDVIGNIEASQNIYAMNRMSVGHSNPTEAFDVIGNAKISSNAYVMRSLGIGTSNPSSNLHVVGTALVTGVLTTQAVVNAGGSILVTSTDPGPLVQTNYNQSTTDNRYGIGQFTNGQLRVYTAGSHTPATLSLSLAQASGAFEDMLTVKTNGKSVDINGPTQINANLLVTSNVGIGSINSSYRLHVQGDIYATSDVIGFSDKRYKDNITPIADALDIINNMQGCYYTRGSNVIKRHIGFMAQDLQEVLPEVVRYDASNDLYGVNYGNITALLCEGIKALHREIQVLKEQKN